jgi:hypothetical protein
VAEPIEVDTPRGRHGCGALWARGPPGEELSRAHRNQEGEKFLPAHRKRREPAPPLRSSRPLYGRTFRLISRRLDQRSCRWLGGAITGPKKYQPPKELALQGLKFDTLGVMLLADEQDRMVAGRYRTMTRVRARLSTRV